MGLMQLEPLLAAPNGEVFIVLPSGDSLAAVRILFLSILQLFRSHTFCLAAVGHVHRVECRESKKLVAVDAYLEAFVINHCPHQLAFVKPV